MKLFRIDEIKKLYGVMSRWTFGYVLGLIGVSITGASSMVFLAYVLKNLVDAAGQKNIGYLTNAIILTIAACIFLCLVMPVFEYMFNASIKRFMADVRRRIFDHVTRLKIKYFEEEHSAEIISIINNDVQVMENCYSQDFKNVVYCIVLGLGSAAFMLVMDLWISIILIILGIVTLLVNSSFAGPIRRISEVIQKSTAVVMERFSDILSGFHISKVFGIEKILYRKFEAENREVAEANIKRSKINSWLDSINYLLVWCNFGGVMTIGIFMALNGTFNIGKLMAIIQLLNGVIYMFQNLGNFITKLQASLAGANRVFRILDEEGEPEHLYMGGSELSNADVSKVKLDNVAFSYSTNNKVLDGLTLSVGKGEVAALVGASGGGKSTVFKLLLGFYPADNGNILVDGKPIGLYNLEELRNMIAYVSQDSFLFNVSIKDNIRYGKPDATDEEIEHAAKLAYAHEFIVEQPSGYDTVVGENGVGLSGGQKQRIGIARAFLKNAPILLLDEATSSLDSKSEELVQQALAELMKKRTTIIIAHRLSTIEKADVIYVIDNGKVVEKGTHNSLLFENGIYNRLYNIQFAS